MACSCPDWAEMCKHVAATLYGVGNRLDHQPELLFKLRQVDHMELIAQAASPVAMQGAAKKKTIASSDLAAVFGIELEHSAKPEKPQIVSKTARGTKASPLPAKARLTKPSRKITPRGLAVPPQN
jgi:uncharacterized Zn finger protein